jgi:beta-lactamase class A
MITYTINEMARVNVFPQVKVASVLTTEKATKVNAVMAWLQEYAELNRRKFDAVIYVWWNGRGGANSLGMFVLDQDTRNHVELKADGVAGLYKIIKRGKSIIS